MNKKEFNMSEWLNKKPQEATASSTPVDCCLLPVDSNQSVKIREICGTFSDLQHEIELLTVEIENRAIDIAPDYHSWRDLGFALTDALGENGRDYFHRLSRFYPNYSYEETDKQFTSCLNHHGHGITSKTIFHLAKQSGITISSRPKIPSPNPVPSSITRSRFPPPNPAPLPKTPITSNGVFEVLDENDNISSNQMPSFYNDVKDYLPDFLKKIAGNAISDEDADLLILGTLTAVSACLPNIFGIYAGREVFPNLFLFVTAQASAGKGRLSLCRRIVEPIHRQLREQYAAEMEQYRRLQIEYAMNKKDPDAEMPQEPPLKTLFIPANSSSTAVYQVLNANKGVGLIFETEGDTLANTFKSDFGNFSDGFRKAFHHETISYNRRKDKEFVELEKPRMSALLSGTPRQILSLIPDTENGLFSRFLFYCLNIRIVWNDVFAVQEETLDSHFENYGREFYDLYRLLKISNPIRFALTASQQADFHSFFEQIQGEYSSVFGLDFVASVRRLGLITFRIAMIISSLRILENGHFPNIMLCDDNDFQTAKIMVRTLLKHTAKVYQTLPAIDDETLKNSKNQAKNNYYQSLPSDFDKQTALNVAQTMSIPKTTAERYLKQWCLSAQLNHVKHGMYSKP